MKITDTTWGIIDTTGFCNIFYDYTCRASHRLCISDYVKLHSAIEKHITWKILQKRGYRCVKLNVTGWIK